MTVSETTPPPVGAMGGSVHAWERAPSPWHRDAFPEELADQAPEQGVRRNGWLAWTGVATPSRGWRTERRSYDDEGRGWVRRMGGVARIGKIPFTTQSKRGEVVRHGDPVQK